MSVTQGVHNRDSFIAQDLNNDDKCLKDTCIYGNVPVDEIVQTNIKQLSHRMNKLLIILCKIYIKWTKKINVPSKMLLNKEKSKWKILENSQT